eukprot:TRINITY_DN14647_c0_g1_i8.p1 TRINITY_DN14647_c0_g1~~TRINITY_DN14647_c0_g1_i8.p1  ORF type:complete len:137 (+),score=26.48 TRINITY_DN14647_c0_g1_i8:135-545(+)
MCAFSNASGGTIYLGIKKSGQINGIVCDRQGMDRIRLMIDNNRMSIAPTLLQSSQVRLKAKKVVKEITGKYIPIKNTFIVEIFVSKGLPNETYMLKDERIIIRDGKKNKLLSGVELIQYVMAKAKFPMRDTGHEFN